MAKNRKLGEAKTAKKDEFYTQYEDIQAELNHYESHFKNKTVLCNCDDPFESNFCKFFLRNFNYLGLKRLICTSYTSSPILGIQMTLWDDEDEPVQRGNGYVMDISEVPMANGKGVSDDDIDRLLRSKKRGVRKLEGNGDFRSDECVEYLKQADIVVTNPPFSLFREYIAQLIENGKKFIVISRTSALHYKEVFSLLQNGIIWTGYGFNLTLVYKTPYENLSEKNIKLVKQKGYNPDDGYIAVSAICWLTNIDTTKRHERLTLYKRYTSESYPTYHNFDAINVDRVSEIPVDYYGNMGVPDSFLNSYNPDEFDIVGLGSGYLGQSIGVRGISPEHKRQMTSHSAAGDLYYIDSDGKPKVPYSRIIIRRKEQK